MVDDVGNIPLKLRKTVVMQVILNLVNTVKVPLMKAAIEEKSKVFANQLILILTSNGLWGGLEEETISREALRRRLGLKMKFNIKIEYQTSGGNVDWNKVGDDNGVLSKSCTYSFYEGKVINETPTSSGEIVEIKHNPVNI
jgi:hypothetical protein